MQAWLFLSIHLYLLPPPSLVRAVVTLLHKQLTRSPLPQRFLLAEIIKSSKIPVSDLVEFCRAVNPEWVSLELPRGKPTSQPSQDETKGGIMTPDTTMGRPKPEAML